MSRATVSRVIQNKRRVDPALQEVVARAIETTGYIPNRTARSLATGRTGSVFAAISGSGADGNAESDVFTDPFFGRVVSSFARLLATEDVHLILTLVESDSDRARVRSSLRQGAVDGALLVSTRAADPLPAMLAEAGLTAVTFARPSDAVAMSFVDLDNREGGRLAAEHLLSRGSSSMAVICGPLDVMSAQDRLSGFRDALARHGSPYVRVAVGNFTLESGEAAMAQLLEEDATIDGVFASNDLMAVGAIHELQRQGRRVPADVAVIGFDDSSIATHSRPALTTIRQPIEQMAGEMAQLLLAQILEPDRRPTSVILEPALVVRSST